MAVRRPWPSHALLTGKEVKDVVTRGPWAGRWIMFVAELAHLYYLTAHFCYKFLMKTYITTTVYNSYFLFLVTVFPLTFRNDEQKHKQSGKTVSRKAQKRSEGKGKGKGSKGKWLCKGVGVGAYVRRCNQYEKADVFTLSPTKIVEGFDLPSQVKISRLLTNDVERSQLNTEQRELCIVAYVIKVLSTRPQNRKLSRSL